VDLQVFFADHDLGFAAARNAGIRAARGRIIVWLDTAIELAGDIWTPLERALADPEVGVVGPYALRTDDLKEFYETEGPEADAVEGYLLAFRRALLGEVGMAEEKFRFYRLLDIYMSFMFKTSGYRVRCVPEVADLVVKHPHREWYSLSPEERATKSKKNYDIFRRRWHHGQSLQIANYVAADRWFGHDHPRHLDGAHTHPPAELPPSGQPHSHDHRHWPDHSHSHLHHHRPAATARR
jgi:cysteinyl-tRNA synthetase